jgi:hypothetical protein
MERILPSFLRRERSRALDYPEKYSKIKNRSGLRGAALFGEKMIFVLWIKFYPRIFDCQCGRKKTIDF